MSVSRSFTLGSQVLIALLVVVSYLPVLENEFVDWDDFQCLSRNEHIRSLSGENLRWMATTGHMAQWQPVAWFLIALQYQLFGRAGELSFSHGLHAVSLILQIVSGILCFLVLRRLLAPRARAAAGPADGGPGESRARAAAALTATLVFVVHPLRAELVGWATAQPYLWAMVFCLAAVWFYLRAAGTGRRGPLALSWVLYFLSLLCKPIAVPLVVVLLLLDWFPLGRLGGRRGWTGQRARPVWLEKIPFALLALAVTVITPLAKGGAGSAMSLAAHGLLQRAAQACYGLAFYLWKTLIPTGLSPLYELRLPLDVGESRYLVSILVVVLTCLGLLLFGRGRRGLVVSLLAYAILVFPVLGFFQSGNQEVADRYGFLPALAWSALLAAGLVRLWSPSRSQRGTRLVTGILAVVVVVVTLAGATRSQCRVWRNTAALWTRAASLQEDSSLAQNGFGFVLLEQDRAAEAVPRFRRAIELKPDNDVAHRNLWNALQKLGRTDELVAAYRQALTLFPENWEIHRYLGNVFFRQKMYDDAIASFGRALAARPGDPATLAALAGAFYATGDRAQAVRHARQALEADPANGLAARVLELTAGEDESP